MLAASLLLGSLVWLPGSVAPAAAQTTNPPDAPTGTPDATTSASGSGVRMDLSAGFEGAGRAGSWVPLTVTLDNPGDAVQAEVQVNVPTGGNLSSLANLGRPATASGATATTSNGPSGPTTTFTLPVLLPHLSEKQYTLPIVLPTSVNKLTARLVRTSDHTAMAEQEVSMNRVPLGDYFCGILARDPSSYDFLGAIDLPAPIRRVRTAALDPSTIPSQAQLLGSFDCLIVDNAATAQLRPEQLNAIQIWTAAGGLLITVGGANWKTSLAPLPPDLVPVNVTGLATVNSLSALGTFFNTPFPDSGQWLVSQARPTVGQGANVVVSQDGVPLVVDGKRGDGTIVYLAFDPTAHDVRTWAGSEPLWRYLITQASVDSGIGSTLVRPYLRWGRAPRVGLTDFSTHPAASLDWLWWLSGAYALVLGGTLFVLTRRGNVGATVFAAMGVTAVFSVLSFAAAAQRADPTLSINQLEVIRPIDPGVTGAAYTHTYVAVLPKQNTSLDMELPEGALASVLATLGAQRPPTAVLPSVSVGAGADTPTPTPVAPFQVSESAAPVVQNLAVKQGQVTTMQIDGQLRQAPTVQSDLEIDGGYLNGSITNRTGQRISNAHLVLDDQVLPTSFQSIERGQQVPLVDLPLPNSLDAGMPASNKITDALAPNTTSPAAGAAIRRDLVDSVFSPYVRGASQYLALEGLTLIGWLDQAPQPVLVPSLRTSTSDFVLLVQPLQVTLPRGFDGEVPASALERRELSVASTGATDTDHFTVQQGQNLSLQFTLPPSNGTFQLQELRLNVDGTITSQARVYHPFTVQLFNWITGDWQGWDIPPGQSIIPNGQQFVSAAGDVRVRYAVDTAQGSGAIQSVRITRLDVTPIGTVR